MIYGPYEHVSTDRCLARPFQHHCFPFSRTCHRHNCTGISLANNYLYVRLVFTSGGMITVSLPWPEEDEVDQSQYYQENAPPDPEVDIFKDRMPPEIGMICLIYVGSSYDDAVQKKKGADKEPNRNAFVFCHCEFTSHQKIMLSTTSTAKTTPAQKIGRFVRGRSPSDGISVHPRTRPTSSFSGLGVVV